MKVSFRQSCTAWPQVTGMQYCIFVIAHILCWQQWIVITMAQSSIGSTGALGSANPSFSIKTGLSVGTRATLSPTLGVPNITPSSTINPLTFQLIAGVSDYTKSGGTSSSALGNSGRGVIAVRSTFSSQSLSKKESIPAETVPGPSSSSTVSVSSKSQRQTILTDIITSSRDPSHYSSLVLKKMSDFSSSRSNSASRYAASIQPTASRGKASAFVLRSLTESVSRSGIRPVDLTLSASSRSDQNTIRQRSTGFKSDSYLFSMKTESITALLPTPSSIVPETRPISSKISTTTHLPKSLSLAARSASIQTVAPSLQASQSTSSSFGSSIQTHITHETPAKSGDSLPRTSSLRNLSQLTSIISTTNISPSSVGPAGSIAANSLPSQSILPRSSRASSSRVEASRVKISSSVPSLPKSSPLPTTAHASYFESKNIPSIVTTAASRSISANSLPSQSILQRSSKASSRRVEASRVKISSSVSNVSSSVYLPTTAHASYFESKNVPSIVTTAASRSISANSLPSQSILQRSSKASSRRVEASRVKISSSVSNVSSSVYLPTTAHASYFESKNIPSIVTTAASRSILANSLPSQSILQRSSKASSPRFEASRVKISSSVSNVSSSVYLPTTTHASYFESKNVPSLVTTAASRSISANSLPSQSILQRPSKASSPIVEASRVKISSSVSNVSSSVYLPTTTHASYFESKNVPSLVTTAASRSISANSLPSQSILQRPSKASSPIVEASRVKISSSVSNISSSVHLPTTAHTSYFESKNVPSLVTIAASQLTLIDSLKPSQLITPSKQASSPITANQATVSDHKAKSFSTLSSFNQASATSTLGNVTSVGKSSETMISSFSSTNAITASYKSSSMHASTVVRASLEMTQSQVLRSEASLSQSKSPVAVVSGTVRATLESSPMLSLHQVSSSQPETISLPSKSRILPVVSEVSSSVFWSRTVSSHKLDTLSASVSYATSYPQSSGHSLQGEVTTSSWRPTEAYTSSVSKEAGRSQDFVVHSSLYPCWVTFFVDRSIDASVIYPNQTLLTKGTSKKASYVEATPSVTRGSLQPSRASPKAKESHLGAASASSSSDAVSTPSTSRHLTESKLGRSDVSSSAAGATKTAMTSYSSEASSNSASSVRSYAAERTNTSILVNRLYSNTVVSTSGDLLPPPASSFNSFASSSGNPAIKKRKRRNVLNGVGSSSVSDASFLYITPSAATSVAATTNRQGGKVSTPSSDSSKAKQQPTENPSPRLATNSPVVAESFNPTVGLLSKTRITKTSNVLPSFMAFGSSSSRIALSSITSHSGSTASSDLISSIKPIVSVDLRTPNYATSRIGRSEASKSTDSLPAFQSSLKSTSEMKISSPTSTAFSDRTFALFSYQMRSTGERGTKRSSESSFVSTSAPPDIKATSTTALSAGLPFTKSSPATGKDTSIVAELLSQLPTLSIDVSSSFVAAQQSTSTVSASTGSTIATPHPESSVNKDNFPSIPVSGIFGFSTTSSLAESTQPYIASVKSLAVSAVNSVIQLDTSGSRAQSSKGEVSSSSLSSAVARSMAYFPSSKQTPSSRSQGPGTPSADHPSLTPVSLHSSITPNPSTTDGQSKSEVSLSRQHSSILLASPASTIQSSFTSSLEQSIVAVHSSSFAFKSSSVVDLAKSQSSTPTQTLPVFQSSRGMSSATEKIFVRTAVSSHESSVQSINATVSTGQDLLQSSTATRPAQTLPVVQSSRGTSSATEKSFVRTVSSHKSSVQSMNATVSTGQDLLQSSTATRPAQTLPVVQSSRGTSSATEKTFVRTVSSHKSSVQSIIATVSTGQDLLQSSTATRPAQTLPIVQSSRGTSSATEKSFVRTVSSHKSSVQSMNATVSTGQDLLQSSTATRPAQTLPVVQSSRGKSLGTDRSFVRTVSSHKSSVQSIISEQSSTVSQEVSSQATLSQYSITPLVPFSTQDVLTSSQSKQITPPTSSVATSSRGSKLLTSSLGQCIRYFTSQLKPTATVQPMVTSTAPSLVSTFGRESSGSRLANQSGSTLAVTTSIALSTTSSISYLNASSEVASGVVKSSLLLNQSITSSYATSISRGVTSASEGKATSSENFPAQNSTTGIARTSSSYLMAFTSSNPSELQPLSRATIISSIYSPGAVTFSSSFFVSKSSISSSTSAESAIASSLRSTFLPHVPTSHVPTSHVPTSNVSTSHVSTSNVSTSHVSTSHVSTSHVSTSGMKGGSLSTDASQVTSLPIQTRPVSKRSSSPSGMTSTSSVSSSQSGINSSSSSSATSSAKPSTFTSLPAVATSADSSKKSELRTDSSVHGSASTVPSSAARSGSSSSSQPTKTQAVFSSSQTGPLAISATSLTTTEGATMPMSSSSVLPATPTAPTTPPIAVGLCRIILLVSRFVDVFTLAFKGKLEKNLLDTYLILKLKRRRRAVARGNTALNITSITRVGSSESVSIEFYVTESDVVVRAETTSATFNQMRTAALSARLNETVASSVAVATAATKTPVTVAPAKYHLLGMVIKDEASNNISVGNNKLTFESRMANFYKSISNTNENVTFTVYYIKHEVKSIVYLEFYVTVANSRQNSSTVAAYYRNSIRPVSTATLSALLKMTVYTTPYAISSITASDLYQVMMTIRPVALSTNVHSPAFKDDLALRITTVFREGKDKAARRKRRALGSISTTILSVVSSSDNKAVVKFFILDRAVLVNGALAASILNRVGVNRMSNLLSVEVVVSPAAVAVSPIPAASSTIDLWIIGVVLGACVIMLLLFACLYWRWKSGGPQQKLDLEKIQMTEKVNAVNKPYGGYRDVANFAAEGRSDGAKGLKTTAFIEPDDRDEKPDLSRSMRRKAKPVEANAQRNINRPPVGRQNVAYEESEDEYDEDEEEEEDDDDEDYESEVPPPPKPQPQRQVNAQRKVEVQPGPSRVSERVGEKLQKKDADGQREDLRPSYEEETGTESEEDAPKKRDLPSAAELPPLSQMKDVQEAPSYPPVRFRTNIEPESSRAEHLPPIMKHTSLTGRQLPEIDPDLQQKADLERSRNKQRQRLRASGRWPSGGKQLDAPVTDKRTASTRAWRKAQDDIDALLDPMSVTLKQSPRSNKRAKRRHRLRRSHKVDIAVGDPNKGSNNNKNVKLNNYMTLDGSTRTSETEGSFEEPLDIGNEKNIEETRERIHNLLDDAFSLLDPYQRSKASPREKVDEKVVTSEAILQQAAPDARPLLPQYPALPPPPHGRAAPRPGERKRTINYPTMQSHYGPVQPNESQILTPVFTRDPMVVMDRAERNRYLSQRVHQPAYVKPHNSLGYPYEQFANDGPVYITPVQQQPDGLGGVIWSPYAAEALRNDVNNSNAPLFNTMDSPERERSKMAPTVSSTPARRTYGSMQPHNTSLDMNSSIYDNVGFGSSPQPLIRAIKDELFRLSQTAKGRTQIQNLRDSQGDRPPPVT